MRVNGEEKDVRGEGKVRTKLGGMLTAILTSSSC